MTTTQETTTKSVTDYLTSLVWDGTPRIDRWLVEYAGANDSPYVRAASRAMLVAAVRRARRPGCRVDHMPIFDGPQGCGKSAALRLLAVEPEWFSDDLPLSLGARQLIEATAGKWIVEAGELEHLARAQKNDGEDADEDGDGEDADEDGDGEDAEADEADEDEADEEDELPPAAALKMFLSRSVDQARMAYQREVTRVPRRFMVVGTTAATPFLSDATGDRRLWPIAVKRFDLERLAEVRDQLWAEAAAAEAGGEPIDLANTVASA